jgi:hypothetical protein
MNVLFCNVAQPVCRATVATVVCPTWRDITQAVEFIITVCLLRNTNNSNTALHCRKSRTIPFDVYIVGVADCMYRQANELGCPVSTEYSMTLNRK